jgi:hypothetical protein
MAGHARAGPSPHRSTIQEHTAFRPRPAKLPLAHAAAPPLTAARQPADLNWVQQLGQPHVVGSLVGTALDAGAEEGKRRRGLPVANEGWRWLPLALAQYYLGRLRASA